jgi:hypothetical protein
MRTLNPSNPIHKPLTRKVAVSAPHQVLCNFDSQVRKRRLMSNFRVQDVTVVKRTGAAGAAKTYTSKTPDSPGSRTGIRCSSSAEGGGNARKCDILAHFPDQWQSVGEQSWVDRGLDLGIRVNGEDFQPRFAPELQ